MSCKNCSDVTLLSGSDGNGIQTIVDNGDGTFTIFMTDGSTFITPDFTGTPGTPGAAATIAVGAVTTGLPNTAPTVTNTGSPAAAVFAFQFPIGIIHHKTVFVDLSATVTPAKYRIDLPYPGIIAAITAATSGDTVHIRAGSYTEDITLKDGVNIYCEEGVIINGKITDAGSPAVSVVSGNGVLQDTATTNQCIEITGNGSDVKIRLERITNTGSAILQRATTGASSKLIVETEILSGNIVNYFVTVGGEVDCTIKINQYAETAASTGISSFSGVDARTSPGAPDGFSGTLNFSCPRMVIGNGTNTTSGVALFIEHTTTDTAKVYFNVDQLINNYDQPTYTSVPGAQNEALATLNLNGNGEYLIKVKDCYSKSRVGLMVGVGDAVSAGAIATGTTIFEGMIFSQRSAAVRQVAFNDATNTSKLIIRNSSLSRGIDPQATVVLPDRNSVVILGDAGFGTQKLGGSPTAFDYMNAEFINTQIIKITDDPTGRVAAGATDPSLENGLVCIQTSTPRLAALPPTNNIYFRDCDLISGSLGNNKFAVYSVVAFQIEDILLPYTPANNDTRVYFKNTSSNAVYGVATTPGQIVELNAAGGFIKESDSIRTLNYLHTS